MLAMQYSVRLPREFDIDQVYEHVSTRSPLFDGFPGLKHKFYLYDPEEHIYAPFYIWENTQSAQDFLLHNLFNGVIEAFGRPRVRSWQIIEFDKGSCKEEPTFLYTSFDKAGSQKPLTDIMKDEKLEHQAQLGKAGLYANMVLLDPDRWEIGHFGFWQNRDNAVAVNADCVTQYDVLKMNHELLGVA
ncbi:MAG: DUF4865 family protein [Sneathiella sp.]